MNKGEWGYIRSRFANCIIMTIFDGDSHKDSIKNEEHLNRDCGKSAATVNIRNPNMRVLNSKQEFSQNKAIR